MHPSYDKYEIVLSESGEPAAVVFKEGKRIFLHSRISPGKESIIFGGKFDPRKYDLLIVLGTGLAYHLRALKGLVTLYKKIILIEALKGLDRHVREIGENSFIFSSENISLLCGKSSEQVIEFLENEIDLSACSGVSVLEHPQSVRIFPEYYGKIKAGAEKIIEHGAGTKATEKAFGLRYVKNIISNLRRLPEFYPVKNFFNVFRGMPAVCAASGPSLECAAADIARHQEKFFILAADSALPVLAAHGIAVDFLFISDPQAYIFEHLPAGESRVSAVVASISANPLMTVLDSPVFISLSTHPLAQIIDYLYPGQTGSSDSRTGSVAGDMLEFASLAGFSSAGVCGLDFSFDRFKIYSRGTSYQNRFAQIFSSRFRGTESFNADYILKSSRAFRHEGRFSRRSFIQYLEKTEAVLKNKPENLFYNLEPALMPVSGMRPLAFKAFLEKECGVMPEKQKIIRDFLLSADKCSINPREVFSFSLREEVFKELLSSSLPAEYALRFESKIKGLMASALNISE